MNKCEHEGEIQRICKVLDGNGQPGLIREVAEIKLKVEDMGEDFKKMSTAMSAIAKSMTEQDAIKKHSNETKEKVAKVWGKVGIVASVVFGMLGAIYLILDHIE